jgi:RHS repeat-associated protein
MALTDEAGDVDTTWDYDVFGAVRGLTGSQPNDFTFAGEQVDGSTGLQYLRARYYDPEVGRFLSKDQFFGSVGLPLTQHVFLYALSNPGTLVDPTGHVPSPPAPPYEDSGDSKLGIGGIIKGICDYLGLGRCDGIGGGGQGSGSAWKIRGVSIPRELRLTENQLNGHIRPRHGYESRAANTSKFNKGTDFESLSRTAQNVRPSFDPVRQNYVRTVNAGRPVGIDRATGSPTNFYTVVSQADGFIVTMFPGFP